MKKLIYLMFALMFLASCDSGPQKTFTIELNDLNFVAEGPFFEGPNTFQAEANIDFNAVFEAEGVDISKVKEVKLKSADVVSNDGENFDLFDNFLVQFYGDNFPLKKVANLSTVEKSKSTLSLSPSSEADIKDLFSEKNFFVIIDANLNEEYYEDLSFKGNIVLEVTAAQK
jgi:hypothetical protein